MEPVITLLLQKGEKKMRIEGNPLFVEKINHYYMLTLIIEKCVIVEFHRFQADYVLILITDVGGIILLDSGLTYKTTNPASVYWDITPNLIRYLI